MDVPAKHIGLISVLLATLCWGAAIVMSKSALDSLKPIPLLIVQLGASVLLLQCLIALRGGARPRVKELFKVSLLGLLEPWLTYVLVLIGMTYSGASDAALLQSLESIAIVILAAVIFRERLSIRFIFNAALVFVGLFIALGERRAVGANSWQGVMLVASGMLTAAVYVVISSRVATRYDVLNTIYSQQVVALIASVVTLLIFTSFSSIPEYFAMPWHLWLLAGVSGVVQYALAFCFYLLALKHISAGVAGLFLNLVPLIGMAGAYVFLGEKLGWLQVLGGLLSVIALIFISRITPEAAKATGGSQ